MGSWMGDGSNDGATVSLNRKCSIPKCYHRLNHALGAPWPALSLPDALSERIAFWEFENADVIAAYHRMEEQTIAAFTHPARTTH